MDDTSKKGETSRQEWAPPVLESLDDVYNAVAKAVEDWDTDAILDVIGTLLENWEMDEDTPLIRMLREIEVHVSTTAATEENYGG